ncbi:hypothetical protein J2847_006417 [Azospirillum agricola]|uniref:hypothetical protein n=1 Tax=Azospirillum agricola TaxID=1720247 RepID=UPI001AEA11E9|nr:hypothetical protein [Azospirillum agricola]MBP2233082.1 hypothetical protein [Azospirillum agricola]
MKTNLLTAASLDALLVDENVYIDGRWVQPDPDLPLRIKTKPLGDEYADAQARMQRKAATGLGGDTEKLPVAVKRSINAKCLINHALMDIENAVVGGQALDFEAFCALIQEKRGQKLLGLAFTAATMATEAEAEEVKEAEGN